MQVNTSSYKDTLLKKSQKDTQATQKKELSDADKKAIKEISEKFNNRYNFADMSAKDLRQFVSIMTQVGKLSKEEANALLKLTGADKAPDDERTNVLAKVKGMMESLISSGDGVSASFWNKILGKLQEMQGSTYKLNVRA